MEFSENYDGINCDIDNKGSLIGTLLDVSASMKAKYSNVKEKNVDYQRIRTILDVIMDLCSDFKGQGDFFGLAFGLYHMPTCDIITILSIFQIVNSNPAYDDIATKDLKEYFMRFFIRKINIDEMEKLIKLLGQQNNDNFRKIMTKFAKEKNLSFIYEYLEEDPVLTKHLVDELSSASINQNNFKNVDLFSLLMKDEIKNIHHEKEKENLIILFEKAGALNIRKYISNYIEEKDVLFVHKILKDNPILTQKVVNALPSACKSYKIEKSEEKDSSLPMFLLENFLSNVSVFGGRLGASFASEKTIENKVKEESIRAKNTIMHEIATGPKIRSFKFMKSLIKEYKIKADEKIKNEIKISQLFKDLEPFIYGSTPLCQALKESFYVYEKYSHDNKILFLLSDGAPTDGNPLYLAEKLKQKNVTIFSCLITDEILSIKELFDSENKQWSDAAKLMFSMSSSISSSDYSLNVLTNYGWTIPSSNECKLFAQVNDPALIEEIVDSLKNLNESDALVDFFGKVDLDLYVNKCMNDFVPKEQINGTCYANAVAATLHLALNRIAGYNIPDFFELRKEIIIEFGENGANTKSVLEKYCKKYRPLRCNEIDENGARQAIIRKRPIVSTFRLTGGEWNKFSEFYKTNPKGILDGKDLINNKIIPDEDGGHAVVLIRCTKNCLVFLNSWGTSFADNGFFRVKNASVLKMKFYDVFWFEKDLLPKEREAYKKQEESKIKKELNKSPNILKNLNYRCPLCHLESKIKEYNGNIFEGSCPKCNGKFKPTLRDLIFNLYNRD